MAQTKEELNAKARVRMAAHRETQAYQDWLVASRELRRALKEKYRRQAGALPKGTTAKRDAHVKAWEKWQKEQARLNSQKEQARLFFLRLGWKLCRKCGLLHSIAHFYRDKSAVDGLLPVCKTCDNNRILGHRKKNPIAKFKHNVRNLITASLKKHGYLKNSPTHEILGCDFDTFIKHIERQFTDGMTWDKVGTDIHIDHIIPLATATTEQEVIALNHHTNLRPLWAEQNLSKAARIEFLI